MRTPFFSNRWIRIAASAVVVCGIAVAAAGCLGLDVAGTFRWPGAKNDQIVPARMAVAWKNDIQKRSGKNMLRGFQGKVQFFAADPPKSPGKDNDATKKNESPSKAIAVDGTLTVYAFEETPDGKEGAGPSKKYVFPSKELKRVHREGPQGHEYNIWMAWDKAGGPETHIRLLVRFDPPGGGQVVMSDNSRELLPGTTVQYAGGASPEARKAPHDSTGHPPTQSDFETGAETPQTSKSHADAASANPLDETR
jgi:hypothetical protein